MRRAIEIALILTVAFLYVNAEEDTGARISLPEYRNRLDSLVRSIENHEDLEALAKNLPSRWTIMAGDRKFVVSTETIRSGLVRTGSRPAGAASGLIESLKLMQAAALQYESAQSEHSAERTAIRNILARREFSGVAGTSWFDRLKNRVQRWLFGLLERILGRIASSCIPGRKQTHRLDTHRHCGDRLRPLGVAQHQASRAGEQCSAQPDARIG